jgi:acyl-CoA thioesterase
MTSPESAPRHAFDADTRVEAVADHRFAAAVTDRWNVLGGRPNGGYVLGICLQALRRVVPRPDPLVVSAFFLRPTLPGPVEVRTALLRDGRRIATGEATLLQNGQPMVRLTAAFTDLDPSAGRTVVLAEPPVLPPPEQSLDLMNGRVIPELTIAERVEYRVAAWPGWARGEPSGRPSQEFWMRFRDGREPDLLALASLVDAAAPPVLELGEPASATVELTVHLRARPAPGWLACRAHTRFVMAGYHEEDFEIWDSTGALVAQSRQLALLP